jgi:anti-sigma regulatory factor (Ser/Thr protein kinase)
VGEPSEDLICLELRCDPDAPCLVREAVDEAVTDPIVRETARLVASELVTNAVRHSGCAPNQTIEFRARSEGGVLRMCVSDPGISGLRAHLRSDPSAGFGLRIVDRLARRWGAEHPNGQRVWAELLVS